MTISKENTRTLIQFPKELKEQLEILAKEDSRSLSNLVVHVMQKYAKEKTK